MHWVVSKVINGYCHCQLAWHRDNKEGLWTAHIPKYETRKDGLFMLRIITQVYSLQCLKSLDTLVTVTCGSITREVVLGVRLVILTLLLVVSRSLLLCWSWLRPRWEKLPDCRWCPATLSTRELCLRAENPAPHAKEADCAERDPPRYLSKVVSGGGNGYIFFKMHIIKKKNCICFLSLLN